MGVIPKLIARLKLTAMSVSSAQGLRDDVDYEPYQIFTLPKIQLRPNKYRNMAKSYVVLQTLIFGGASKLVIGTRSLLQAALLVAAGAGVSGCVYDVGLGYASSGFYDGGYGCDPYGGYDAYYNCDYGQGFANIGFGGGYFDNYYYPGYGFFLFDNVGRRYPMRDNHRRY